MTTHDGRRLPRHLLALAAVGLLAACADSPTESGYASGGSTGPSFAEAAGGPSLVPNGQRYREQMYRHASNRAGSATLVARALLGKDGVTVLEATTGELDQAGAPGNISKSQVKLLDPARNLLSTRNYNGLRDGGSFTRSYEGQQRHGWVQIQVNVQGIDPKRTGVVTVLERVNLRPDISVVGMQAPQQERVNQPVTIVASIQELNGDVGATGRCVLYVNGAPVDQAEGVWVAEGDPVDCEFTHAFTTVGTHTYSVKFEGVTPGDWDTANNARSGSIQIVQPGTQLQGRASAWQLAQDYVHRYRSTTTYYASGEQHTLSQASETHYVSQQASLYGSAVGSMDLSRVAVNVAITSDGREIATMAGAATHTAGSGCVLHYGSGGSYYGGYHLVQVCLVGGSTRVDVRHSSGRATYLSHGTHTRRDGSGNEYYHYEWGSPEEVSWWSWGDQKHRMGTSVKFQVEVTDGTQTYTAAPEVTLQSTTSGWGDTEERRSTFVYPGVYETESFVTAYLQRVDSQGYRIF